MRRRPFLFVGVGVLWSGTAAVFAQESATPQGTVADATGAVIPGAVVTATLDTTGIATTVETDDSGDYAFSALPPGTFTVIAEAPGFAPGIRRDVELKAGPSAILAFSLELEAVDTVVVVGTRAQPRSVTQSPVPIDVIASEDILAQGDTSLDYMLRTVVPSYNVNVRPIGDEAVCCPGPRTCAVWRLITPWSWSTASAATAPVRSSGGPAASIRAARGRTSPPFRQSRCGRSKCCETAPPPSTARTRSPACSTLF